MSIQLAGYRASGLGWSGAVILLFAIGQASNCEAHQKWLWPNTYYESKAPVWISFDVTWSDRPFTAESGIGDKPLEVIGPNGEVVELAQKLAGKTKSTAEAQLTVPGTYRLQSIDPLAYWTRVMQGGKEVWLKKPKNEVQGAEIVRSDLYWSKALAHVTIGEETKLTPPDDSEPLAIVLAKHPHQLRRGEEVELRVVSYGKPVANAVLQVFNTDATGHEPTRVVRCDDQGVGRVPLETVGQCLVSCELERKAADDPKADIHAFNIYLTLWIRADDPE